jgi:hypothetical protein
VAVNDDPISSLKPFYSLDRMFFHGRYCVQDLYLKKVNGSGRGKGKWDDSAVIENYPSKSYGGGLPLPQQKH